MDAMYPIFTRLRARMTDAFGEVSAKPTALRCRQPGDAGTAPAIIERWLSRTEMCIRMYDCAA